MSLRKAINDKCKECIYDPDATGLGSALNQITSCEITDCPLWAVRPTNLKYKEYRNGRQRR